VACSFHDWDRSQQNRRGNGGNFEENAAGQEAAGTNQSTTHDKKLSGQEGTKSYSTTIAIY